MKTYDQIMNQLPIGTIKKMYELENFELNKHVIKFISQCLSDRFRLRILDSTGNRFGDFEYNLKLEITVKIEYIKDSPVIDLVDIDENFIRIKILEMSINVSSTKVIYAKIYKKLIYW